MEDHKELIFEISQLKKDKTELVSENKVLKKQVHDLQREVENYKNTLAKLPPELVEKEYRPDTETRSLRFKMATVLYIDIHGFKEIAATKDSREYIDQLDQIYFEFDQIAKRHKILKIRTLGDSYMCAGGVPEKNITNPLDVVLAALEMKAYTEKYKIEVDNGDGVFWEFKFGIHTGPVTANIRGKKKISYDLTGEPVTIATRLAAAGEVCDLIISDMTHVLVQGYFVCKEIGSIPARYQGNIEMFKIKRIKPAFSEDRKTGLYPNSIFKTRYLLRQFTDLQEVILDRLTVELPSFLYYHDVRHTIDVVNQAEIIGIGEGVDDESILLLKTAALYHDLGHVVGYDNHEFFGTQIAKEMLPKYNYDDDLIDKICEVIMATKMPPDPQTLLQKIICDSDLDYLGRKDFIAVSDTLYKELHEQNKIGSLNDWNKLQVKFLEIHHFYTNTSKSLREVNKQHQIGRIQELIVDD